MNLEFQRERIQEELDAKKTQLERNKLGQFATPYHLATEIMNYAKKNISSKNVSFLEPSIGTGAFFSAFLKEFKGKYKRALGFEIDPHYYIPTKKLWSKFNLELRLADFLEADVDKELFDLIVANPPYSRHHHISMEKKIFLQNQILLHFGIKISGLAGLYCYFLILSTIWLKHGGLSCWLIPSEFMDVNYGCAIKRFLRNNVELLRIHKFDAGNVQFNDAMVTSSIVVFRNNPPTNNPILFSYGESFTRPSKSKFVCSTKIDPSEKWSNIFYDKKMDNTDMTLGNFFNVKRGLVTGDNKFFILSRSTIKKYDIPQKFLLPVLQGPRYIEGDIIDSSYFDSDKINYLFNCDIPETKLKDLYPSVWDYVKYGMQNGIQNGYICSRRSPWYSCERRTPAPFLIPYMGRNKASNRVFRFILNKTSILATNVYLLLYLKPEYETIANNEKIMYDLWENLNSIPSDVFNRNGRVYGGGLHKIEPKELMNIPVSGVDNILERITRLKQRVSF